MAKTFKYCAFISYSHRDEKWAAWLHKALETYRVPKHLIGTDTAAGKIQGRLGKVFRDREELPSSQNLGDELMQALSDSACLIVICSPHAAASHWTNEEILAYKRLGREGQIFSLIVDGEPNASQDPKTADLECFPPALRFTLGDDGNLSDELSEPIAADARPHGDGKQNAKLKLISGMLRVGFDALKQREQLRRHRRLLAITTASVAGMVFAAGLATYAIVQRNAAEEQRMRAENEAQIARETRDFMIGLFEVSDPSEAAGNTVTAREILDKGAERIEHELSGQPVIQATLMETMGTVYTSLGLYRPATELLHGALAKKQEFLEASHPDIARTLEHYGEVLMLNAEYDQAEQAYRDALAISIAQLGDESAQTASIKAELADLLKRKGNYAEAAPLFREALSVRRRLLGNESSEVAKTLDGLAMNYYLQGDLETPIGLLEEAITIRRKIHASPHMEFAETLNNLGLVHRRSNNIDAAERLYREALEMKEFLLQDNHPELAMSLNNLAVVLRNQNKNDEAGDLYRRAIRMQRQLLGDRHPDVALGLHNLAFVLVQNGDLAGAIAANRESLDIYKEALGHEHPSVARGMASLALWLAYGGNYAAAEPLARESLAIRQKVRDDSHPDIAGSMTIIAYILVETGRFAEAYQNASRAHAIFVDTLTEDHWFTAAAMSMAGAALTGLREYARAEELLTRSYATLRDDSQALQFVVAGTQQRLVTLYERWGKDSLAEQYRASIR